MYIFKLGVIHIYPGRNGLHCLPNNTLKACFHVTDGRLLTNNSKLKLLMAKKEQLNVVPIATMK